MIQDPQGLPAFYASTYPRLVAFVGAVGDGGRSEAEEAVQEAFIRLIPRWDKIRRYDDPEAWVRRVAVNIISNRRRKARNGLRALVQLGPPQDVPPTSLDRIDIERAVAALPVKHREVLVLHHLGLEVASIAAQLDLPVGTVKSRLSRARAALAPLLQEEQESRDVPA